jgi:hypothetical protein
MPNSPILAFKNKLKYGSIGPMPTPPTLTFKSKINKWEA